MDHERKKRFIIPRERGREIASPTAMCICVLPPTLLSANAAAASGDWRSVCRGVAFDSSVGSIKSLRFRGRLCCRGFSSEGMCTGFIVDGCLISGKW